MPTSPLGANKPIEDIDSCRVQGDQSKSIHRARANEHRRLRSINFGGVISEVRELCHCGYGGAGLRLRRIPSGNTDLERVGSRRGMACAARRVLDALESWR